MNTNPCDEPSDVTIEISSNITKYLDFLHFTQK